MNTSSPQNNLLIGLNPEQIKAVTWPPKSALVLAGAGSGKTRVLTTRIAWLLSTGQATPSSIMAVTFTNKAAREMQARLSVQGLANVRTMWIGTFHGLCNRMLRLHWRDAGLPQTFQILDQADQLAAIKRLLKTLNISDELYPSRQVQSFINHHKEAGVRPNALGGQGDSLNYKQMITLYAEYEAQCRREGVVDFAELLLRSYELLTHNQVLAVHYQERFRHILVDEFQDTNHLQYAWLRCLCGEQSAIFAVGDDDQSIYAFRGAEVGNMQSLLQDFGVGDPIRLEQNYRSAGNILDAANAVIEHNDGRLGKSLWTEAGEGEKIRLYDAVSDREEAEFIVDEIKALHNEGMPLSNMAVLYRSNAQSRLFEHVLVNSGVAYRIYGGLRFFERQEIKHAMAYLRMIANPDDDNTLLRIINMPARGIGTRTIEHLMSVSSERGISLWQAACAGGGGRSAEKINRFVLLIEQLRQRAESLTLAETISLIIDDSGLRHMYEADKKEGEDRLANLNELISAAVDFMPDEPEQAVIEFLTAAALEAGDHQADAGADAVQLMTIHAAKGLEFDAVFVSGLEEGLFPHENSLGSVKDVQEERRLMYVAITRARHRLYLSCAQTRMLHGRSVYPIRSRFIEDIPPQLLHVLSSYHIAKMPEQAPWLQASHAPTHSAHSVYRIGQSVEHPKFGLGVIVNTKAAGNGTHLQINFAESGMKWLDADHAKLTIT